MFLCCCGANQVKVQIQEETRASVIEPIAFSTSSARVVQDQEEETSISTASSTPFVRSAHVVQVSFDQVTTLNHDAIADFCSNYEIMTGKSLTIPELIERCPYLIKLDLSEEKFTPHLWREILQAVKNLRDLRELNLMWSNFSDEVAEGLSELRQVKKLNLNFSCITEASFRFFFFFFDSIRSSRPL